MLNQSDDLSASLALLERLVEFDTVSTKTNLPLIAAVEDYLGDYGIAFTRVPNAAAATRPPCSRPSVRRETAALCSPVTRMWCRSRGQDWASDPFQLRREGSRLYGRGTCDMKAFDAICLAMLPVFQKADLKRPVHLLSQLR